MTAAPQKSQRALPPALRAARGEDRPTVALLDYDALRLVLLAVGEASVAALLTCERVCRAWRDVLRGGVGDDRVPEAGDATASGAAASPTASSAFWHELVRRRWTKDIGAVRSVSLAEPHHLARVSLVDPDVRQTATGILVGTSTTSPASISNPRSFVLGLHKLHTALACIRSLPDFYLDAYGSEGDVGLESLYPFIVCWRLDGMSRSPLCDRAGNSCASDRQQVWRFWGSYFDDNSSGTPVAEEQKKRTWALLRKMFPQAVALVLQDHSAGSPYVPTYFLDASLEGYAVGFTAESVWDAADYA